MKNFFRLSFISALTLLASVPALAEEVAGGKGGGLYAIGAALAIGIAAFGGAIGQGKAAAAALDGIARNPAAQGKIFVPMIIGLALIESLVIYALIIAFNLSGKA
ncbi:MAG: ATP synthase F0 subunit C [Oligoflexia bacterium]|nr:ATP synthase F0 subunit C [Oligoflexia bacterium]